MNLKGAYLEVWSDMLGSIGVMIGAMVIYFTGWAWVDSVIAVAIGLWVLPRTWTLLKASMNILLEGVPEGIGLDQVASAICAVPQVQSVHDLHIWAITSDKISLTVHVVCSESTTAPFDLMQTIRSLLAEQFAISHVTVQLEQTPCEQASEEHVFTGPSHAHGGGAPHFH